LFFRELKTATAAFRPLALMHRFIFVTTFRNTKPLLQSQAQQQKRVFEKEIKNRDFLCPQQFHVDLVGSIPNARLK